MNVISEPFEIAFAKNPVVYQVKSKNLYSNSEIYPNVILTFDDKAEQGDGFRFQITDPDSGKPVFFKFTASPVVDADGWIYINKTHVGTLAEYTEEIFNQLSKNELLAYYFTLNYDGDVQITFTANFAVADLIPVDFEKIQFNLFATPSDHFDFVISETYLKKVRRENFRMLADIFFEDERGSNQWRKVARLTESPDDEGVSVFDISSILKHELESSFDEPPVPAYGSDDVYRNNLSKRYYISFCENWENQRVPDYWQATTPKFVHWGGVSLEDWTKGNPFSFLALTQNFLTWFPNDKIMKKNQNDWLSWINFKNETIDVYFQIRVYWTDGTDSGWTAFGGTFTVESWDGITAAVGYDQRAIADVDPAKTPFKWEISVKEDGGGIVSVVRTYRVNDVINLHDRELMYLNGLGAPETFMTVGEWETVEDIEKQNSERQLPVGYKIINGQSFQFNQNSRTTYSAESGFLDPDHLLSLKTVLQGTNVFLNDLEWIPVIIYPDSFSIGKDLRFLSSLKFELARSFKTQTHSLIGRKPTFSPIVGCSFTGFNVDTNGQEVETFGSMDVIKDGVTIESGVAYDGGSGSYTFPAKYEVGTYQIQVELLMADGSDLSYNFNFELKHEVGFVDVPDKGAVEIIMANRTGEFDTKVFVDWDLTLDPEEFMVSTTPTTLNELIYHKGRKRVKISTLCPEKIGFIHLDENTKDFNLNAFNRLTKLKLSFCQTEGGIDISAFKELEDIEITDTSIESIEFGFHPGLTYCNLQSNLLSADEIELILIAIWKWRQYYPTGSKSIFLGGNPGSGLSMTSTSLAIINGIGVYSGEGLASDYSFSISY